MKAKIGSVQVCSMAANCSSVPSAEHPLYGGRRAHELVSVLHLVLGVHADSGAVSYYLFGALVLWRGS